MLLQNIPVFQGLRQKDAVHKADAIVPQAAATTQDVATEVDQRLPVQNIHEAADMEEMLKELDACGVSV